MERNAELKLEAGKFYIDRDGYIWCCYRIATGWPEGSQAQAIRLQDGRQEAFYRDGRYDKKGLREHTLMRELPAGLLDKDGSTRTIA